MSAKKTSDMPRHMKISGIPNFSDAVRKIFSWRPEDKLVAVGAVLLLVVAIIPLLRLTLYAIPWYDDYNYGNFVKNFLVEEYSLPSAIKGAVYCVKTQWYCWQGTFSSVFFMAMMPAVWGEQYYFLGPAFLILILAFSTFLFMWTLLRNVLKAQRASVVAVSALCSCMVLMFVYTAQSGFYWYNAGVHYVGMHSFFLLLAAGWIKLLAEGTGKAASAFLVLWTMAGALLAGGANYVTALQTLLLGIFLAVLGGILKKKQTLLMLPSFTLLLFAFYKNAFAPGNAFRSDIYKDMGYSINAISAILRSFVEAFLYIREFSGLRTVAVLILFIPVIWRMLKGTTFWFRYPVLILLLSFCFYATGFTPSLYTLGHAGLSRTLNAVKITWQLLLVINEIYVLGWLRQRMKREEGLHLFKWHLKIQNTGQTADSGCRWWFYPLIGMVIFLIFRSETNPIGMYSSFGAYYYVHTGEAYNLRQEYEQRVETIKNGGADVVVEPYNFKPWFLCSGDLSDNPGQEENKAIASWYYKNSVVCK